MGKKASRHPYCVNRDYFQRFFGDNVDHVSRNATLHAMKLSVRGEYAIRALLVLALNYGEDVVRIQDISQKQNIPKKFLEQILNDLKALGAVESRRGAAGGYRLARPPQHITLSLIHI